MFWPLWYITRNSFFSNVNINASLGQFFPSCLLKQLRVSEPDLLAKRCSWKSIESFEFLMKISPISIGIAANTAGCDPFKFILYFPILSLWKQFFFLSFPFHLLFIQNNSWTIKIPFWWLKYFFSQCICKKCILQSIFKVTYWYIHIKLFHIFFILNSNPNLVSGKKSII